MKFKLQYGAKIIFHTLVLSLVPICVLTLLNVNNARKELSSLVRQDFMNMTGFVWEILNAHYALVKEAEIGEEVMWILQAREQEKEFIIKEDEQSVKNWHALMDRIRKSPVHVGDVPAALLNYEAVFEKFTKGMLADLGELTRSGEALETQIRKWIKVVATAEYQETIKTKVVGPRRTDGTRDITKGIRIGESGFIFFLKPDGNAMGHPTQEGKNLSGLDFIKSICTMKEGYLPHRHEGIEKLAFFKHFEPWDWIIVIEALPKEVMNVTGIIRAGVVFGLVFAVLVSIAAVFFSRSLARPIQRIAGGLAEGADRVSTASSHVASSSHSLAEGASEQAASIEETSSSLEEMSSMTKLNADNARQADVLMKEANTVIVRANTSMNALTSSMDQISKSSEETSKIIKTIDEIAFQTNLLALNAAVEAARAGEAGAGFAVVADEVRNLALRAAEAARNTSGLIEGTVKRIQEGSELVVRTSEAFGEVARSGDKVGKLVAEISSASREQAQGIDQVNRAVTEIDKVVQQAAANAEESASASEEMSAQARRMKEMIEELVALMGRNRSVAITASALASLSPVRRRAASE
jgi:hypothetical protein